MVAIRQTPIGQRHYVSACIRVAVRPSLRANPASSPSTTPQRNPDLSAAKRRGRRGGTSAFPSVARSRALRLLRLRPGHLPPLRLATEPNDAQHRCLGASQRQAANAGRGAVTHTDRVMSHRRGRSCKDLKAEAIPTAGEQADCEAAILRAYTRHAAEPRRLSGEARVEASRNDAKKRPTVG
ncbi:hypothetical protein SKAU_G00413980 [Synaphobranchus kaupii]|uniref:Uncharacterized protein n=1 Tax=Synaphobranchus kaupii TaxID=118154 RepID=A0A9Q1IAI3_SYNKA|nr:hypothetical protein SKAU_G00413980 [Synaphobranchus kaupii]